ncbi:MAG: CPBP family intramembrane glutamic endopeptidase [Anaerolineae bacterium]
MSTATKTYIGLAIIVIAFYLGLTYLPQLTGTCMDGECGYSVGEILISIAFPLAGVVLPIALEMILFGKGLTAALSDLGITRFSWTGIRIALIYLLPLIVFIPLFALLTQASLRLNPNWGWLILNLILVNGLAEETMMRGFVFRHLRSERTFWRAAALSTVYFAAYHIPLIFTNGAAVGITSVTVAIPLGLLTAYIYERSGNTIWGAVLLHSMYNGLVMLFLFPADIQPIASLLYLLVGIIVSTLMLVQSVSGRLWST